MGEEREKRGHMGEKGVGGWGLGVGGWGLGGWGGLGVKYVYASMHDMKCMYIFVCVLPVKRTYVSHTVCSLSTFTISFIDIFEYHQTLFYIILIYVYVYLYVCVYNIERYIDVDIDMY